MIKGNQEFNLLDEQKVVYEDILEQSKKSKTDEKKRVYIVNGGPGTGKSVVAINLLVELTNNDQFCQYVSKNRAPRNVYSAKLSIAYKSDHKCLFLNHPVPQIRPSSALTRPKLKESPKW